ncbi:MAG TPA: hypothetical protein V6C65_02160 [Allocoleopsis sp.]
MQNPNLPDYYTQIQGRDHGLTAIIRPSSSLAPVAAPAQFILPPYCLPVADRSNSRCCV